MTDTSTFTSCVQTQNSDYYLRDGRCVAVWDRVRAKWRTEHATLGASIMATMPLMEGVLHDLRRCLGRRLIFSNGIVTSTVVGVEQPRAAA